MEHADTDYILTATSGYEGLESIFTPTTPFDIRVAGVSATTSAIAGTDGVIDGKEDAQVTIELRDAYGNPVADVIPKFSATGEGNTYMDCDETDNQGVSRCAMSSTHPEFKTLHLTEPVEVEGETIKFFVWDCDETSSPFGGGTGITSDDPYRLCAPNHLEAIGTVSEYLDKEFIVARPIDMEGLDDFNPIGKATEPFTGDFDGGHQPIRNLVIDRPRQTGVGLFGHIGNSADLKNIVLENVDVRGAMKVGSLAGENRGWITNSYSSGAVVSELGQTGGLVGANHGRIISSHVAGSVAGGAAQVGGLAGYNESVIIGSSSTANVQGGWPVASGNVGGLVGANRGGISESYAAGDVEGLGSNIGGLVGVNEYAAALIMNSYATGHVTAVGKGDGDPGVYVGGLVGENNMSEIGFSYATGTVEGGNDVGGLVGRTFGSGAEVTSCTWDSSTSGQSTSAGGVSMPTSGFSVENLFTEGGWDFTDIWVMGTAPDGETRPIFQWQVE